MDVFLIFICIDLDKFFLEVFYLLKYLLLLREMINCMVNLYGGIMVSFFVILNKILIYYSRS